MPFATPTLNKKVREKFVDHLDTFLIGEMITERFHGPFFTRKELEQELDQRTRASQRRVGSRT